MITFIIEKLIALIGPLTNLKHQKREDVDAALRAISRALTETCIYCHDIESGRPRDLKTENQLARLWSDAAIPIRHIDQPFAEICQYKAQYWINPENWDEKDTKKLGIDLENVSNRYRSLLI